MTVGIAWLYFVIVEQICKTLIRNLLIKVKTIRYVA